MRICDEWEEEIRSLLKEGNRVGVRGQTHTFRRRRYAGVRSRFSALLGKET